MISASIADGRYAARWLRRNPSFTLIAAASLAVGIGFNSTLFTVLDAFVFRPLPVQRPNQLVDVYTSGRNGAAWSTTSYGDYVDLKSRNAVFSDTLACSLALEAVTLANRPRFAMGEIVSGNYFQVLGLAPHLGRLLQAADDRPGAPKVVVLSYDTWTREYGRDPWVVGRVLRIHEQPYTIIGVAPRSFTGVFTIVAAETWIALHQADDVQPAGIIDTVALNEGTTALDRRGFRWLFVKGRLRDGATVEAAGADLAVIMRQLATAYPATNRERRVSVISTNEVHVHPAAKSALLRISIGLTLVVALVLLTACANVASMLLARAASRRHEIGIRLALGASRMRLLRQLLTETALLSILGGVGGLAIAWLLTRAVLAIPLPIPIPLWLPLRIDIRAFVATALIASAAGVAAGLMPALQATRVNVIDDLKRVAGAPTNRTRWTLRDVLVAGQFAATVVLLVAAGLLARSLFSVQRLDVGFHVAGVAVVSTDLEMLGYDEQRSRSFYDRALIRIRALPGVQAAAVTGRSPLSIDFSRTQFYFPNGPADQKGVDIDRTTVTPEYFATLDIPILQGRNFGPNDTERSPGVVIVNEAFARKFWPNESAVGKRVKTRSILGKEYEIVGVSADYKTNAVDEHATPYAHFSYRQAGETSGTILARHSGNAKELLDAIDHVLRQMDPNIALFTNQTMQSHVDAKLLPQRLGAITVAGVGLIGMALAAIGLYGVVAYSVARRTREISIRMALGAESRTVLLLVMRKGLTTAAVGGVTGAVVALGVAKALSNALYGVSALDTAAWGGTCALLVLVSVLANLAPAIRAARLDPATVMQVD